MNTLLALTLLSLSAVTLANTVNLDLLQKNNDRRLVWNIIVSEETAPLNGAIVVKRSSLTDPSVKEEQESDVYWKPWRSGQIPKDALVGAYGNSECGSDIPIFIAQVFHRGSESAILPGQLYKRSKAIKVSYGRNQYRYKDNIKILCADDPSIVTWVPIKDAGILEIAADEDCVIGGAELSFNTFIGRTNYEDETKIGKVLSHTKTMFFPHEGQEVSITENFDVLCYTRAVETKRLEASKKKVEGEKVNTESELTTEAEIQSSEATTTAKPFSFGPYPRLS